MEKKMASGVLRDIVQGFTKVFFQNVMRFSSACVNIIFFTPCADFFEADIQVTFMNSICAVSNANLHKIQYQLVALYYLLLVISLTCFGLT
jgi:hypothetical protein